MPVGPGDTFSGCLHLVNAWAVENHLFLGQAAVPDGGHEITTMPALLRALDLNEALVTIDAAGCQKEIVRQIREQGGDCPSASRQRPRTSKGGWPSRCWRPCDRRPWRQV